MPFFKHRWSLSCRCLSPSRHLGDLPCSGGLNRRPPWPLRCGHLVPEKQPLAPSCTGLCTRSRRLSRVTAALQHKARLSHQQGRVPVLSNAAPASARVLDPARWKWAGSRFPVGPSLNTFQRSAPETRRGFPGETACPGPAQRPLLVQDPYGWSWEWPRFKECTQSLKRRPLSSPSAPHLLAAGTDELVTGQNWANSVVCHLSGTLLSMKGSASRRGCW